MDSFEEKHRVIEKLVRDMEVLMPYLNDNTINEVMLNPNSQIWVDSASDGMRLVGNMEHKRAQTIIYGIAGLFDEVVSPLHPYLEAELPNILGLKGERFTARVPPIVVYPSFNIRKRSRDIFSLNDYVKSGRLELSRAEIIKSWITQRKNILVAGSPGSGKTTFTNALIQEAVLINPYERFVILEDVCELQCAGDNKLPMLTTSHVSMRDLLSIAMRARPDRIFVGEVRGHEAHDMLKAWNTGCPGGVGTLHANGAKEAIQRVIDLAMEAGLQQPPISLIKQTLDAVIYVARQGSQSGFIKELALITGFEEGQFQFEYS